MIIGNLVGGVGGGGVINDFHALFKFLEVKLTNPTKEPLFNKFVQLNIQ